VKLAAPGFKCVNLDAQTCEFFNDYFAQQLALGGGVRVTTASEISSLLGFERQKQLLGCSDDATSCVAELAGALGVDGLVVGNVARFGTEFAVNVKVLDSRSGQARAAATTRVKSEPALLDWFGATAGQMHRVLAGKGPDRADAVATGPRSGATAGAPHLSESVARPALSPWLPAGAGDALLVAGGESLGLAHAKAAFLRDPQNWPLERSQLQDVANEGRRLETASWVLFGLGAAAVGTAGVLWATGPASGPTLTAAPTPDGAAVALSGVLP
jgi:hypothetical protein